MKIPNYKIRKESFESQREAGRYNPGLELLIGQVVMPLAAGSNDDIDVRTEGDEIYVLTRNYSLGYIGLEVFTKEGSQIGDIFCQSEEEARELLGPNGLNYSVATCIRRLNNYVM